MYLTYSNRIGAPTRTRTWNRILEESYDIRFTINALICPARLLEYVKYEADYNIKLLKDPLFFSRARC